MSFDSGDSFPKVDMFVYGQQIVCCVHKVTQKVCIKASALSPIC